MAGPEGGAGLRDELAEAYDTYRRHCFLPNPPDRPLTEHWRQQGKRTALLFLGMPLLPVILLRLRDYLVRHNVPLLPYACELISTGVWGVSIGRHVRVGPGFILPHGQVVIDGAVSIGRNCAINPWVTIGLSASRRYGFDARGPTIGDDVFIGTGAKLLGPITIGDSVRIGANAVVLDDVPAGATVVGAPARVIQPEQVDWNLAGQAKASL